MDASILWFGLLFCVNFSFGQFMPFLPFKHIHSNTAIDGPRPWFDGEVASKDHCFDKCVKNFTHCEYVQHKQMTTTTWLCRLFNVISDVSNYLVSQTGEMLAQAVHENIGCADWRARGYTQSGIYWIFYNRNKFKVYCGLYSSASWTMIEKRHDGSVNFTRLWQEYKDGFGDLSGEFYLGNENIHLLTKDREMMIYLQLYAFDGTKYAVGLNGFSIQNEANKYKLKSGTYNFGSTDLANAWRDLNGNRFSTADNDNDAGCAAKWKAGWWFRSCGSTMLHGPYSGTQNIPKNEGIVVRLLRGENESFRKLTVLIRPV
ncbi:angiopoietin-1-like [Clytia hemisphaerica]|uniref:Fibrinogen C-terminal domain-containing protein n=1 Tax=Clytia hemisphaerica TaxID=252671 RepID=A0A7M5XI46_9CNID